MLGKPDRAQSLSTKCMELIPPPRSQILTPHSQRLCLSMLPSASYWQPITFYIALLLVINRYYFCRMYNYFSIVRSKIQFNAFRAATTISPYHEPRCQDLFSGQSIGKAHWLREN